MNKIDEITKYCRDLVEDTSFKAQHQWRSEHPDGTIVGYFPVYTPVEIIHAAGALPFGVFGGGCKVKTKAADSRLPSFICSIPRTSLELAMTGDLNFLDLMLFHPICDVCRNLVQIWHRAFPDMRIELLYLPQNIVSKGADRYIKVEYSRLKNIMEEITKRRIDDKALVNSINTYNKQRHLLREIYKVRREKPWLVSATESYVLTRAGTAIPVEEHIGILEGFLKEVPERKAKRQDKITIMYEGAFCEQPPLELIEAIEETCYILDDDFIIGSRWFDVDVPVNGDPLSALASSYKRFNYASIQFDGREYKWERFRKKFHKSGAEAALLSPPKFCEPGLDDQVVFGNVLKKERIPFLAMDFEEKMTSFDQVRMQIETFAESIALYS